MRRTTALAELPNPTPTGFRPHRRPRHRPARSVGRIVVLAVTLVLGTIGVLVVAAILALVLLVAVFDVGEPGTEECPDSSVAILRAAYAGDVAEVERHIDAGERGAADSDGRTALYCAARGGQAEVVQRLTAAGADPNVRNAAGDTPLVWAAQEGDLEVIEALLTAGAEVDFATDGGHTPLLRAVYGGHAEAVDRLLAAGADPNLGGAADSFEAIFAVASVLAGSPPDGPTQDGSVPNGDLALDVMGERTGTVADNITPLHTAVGLRHAEIAQALLLAGADPNAMALGQYTPLHVSAFVGDADLAVLLLFGGADPQPADVEAPAVVARRMGHADVATIIENSAVAQSAAP
jgi:cytohesin